MSRTLLLRSSLLRPTLLGGLLLLPVLGLPLLVASPADARRRIVGGSDLDDEDKKDKEAEAKEKAKREALKKKKAEERAKKSAERKAKAAERKKAEAAARKAAKEASAKKKEDEERKTVEKVEKEAARLEGNKEARLLAAKKQRKYNRRAGDLAFTVTLVPGAPQPDAMVEIRVDVARELDVADVKYGKFKPQQKIRMTANVSPPDTGQDEESRLFRVHNLPTPGAYGFHVTPTREGEHALRLEGKSEDGVPFDVELSLFVGVWPPEDFDSEEANNAKQQGKSASGRRIAGGK